MSKELEALKTIGDLDYIDEYDHRNGSLKQHFNKEFTIIEKGLKALEVIGKKRVNTYSEIILCDDYDEYLHLDIIEDTSEPWRLTPEEFELLKRFIG